MADIVPFYELVAVSYTPNRTSAPTLVEMGVMNFSSLRFKRELNRFSTYSARIEGLNLDPQIARRLANYRTLTTECRIYRNGTLICAGPIISLRFGTRGDISIQGRGVGFWLKYDYLLPANAIESHGDLTDIAKVIINGKQGHEYGNVGIDAETLTEDSTIIGDFELETNKSINCWEALSNLEDEGLNFYFTPDRKFVCPVEGIDRRNEIILNRNNVANPTILVNMGAQRYGNVSSISNSEYSSIETDDDLLASLGRKVLHQTVSKDFSTAALDSISERYLAAFKNPLTQLGGNTLSLHGVSPVAYGLNDILSFEYDFGWNTFFGSYRVRSIDVSVRGDGTEQIVTEEI